MILKIRLLRSAVKFTRGINNLAESIESLKSEYARWMAACAKVPWRKICKWLAKVAAIGATVTGAVTAVSSASSTAGIALGTAGAAGTYATAKGAGGKGYEKIKHVSPKVNQRANAVNMHYQPPMQNKRTTVQKPVALKRG